MSRPVDGDGPLHVATDDASERRIDPLDARIAISGLAAMQPGLPVARAIREVPGFRGALVGISYDPLEPGNYRPDLFSSSHLLPYPAQGAEHVFDRLLAVHAVAPFDVLLPTLDSELPNLVELAPRLRARGIHTLLPSRELLALRSKARLAEWARRAGVSVPDTRVVHSYDAALAAAEELGYPLMVKGQFYEALRAHGPSEIEPHVRHMVRSWGFPVLLQRVVEGTEYDVILLGGRDGELLGAVPMKKLDLDAQGKAWSSMTVADAKLDALVGRAASSLRWPGMYELELLRDKRGDYHLIEINPRVPAWVYLAHLAGQNLPWATVRLALEEAVEPFSRYRVGAMMVRQCVDVPAALGEYESLVTTGSTRSEATPPVPLALRRIPGA